MELRLYDWKWSPFCLKVRCILDYKGLDYERVPILASGGRHYLTVRRRGIGKVPALEVDGRLVVDSTDIAEELERIAPTPPIYPKESRERALDHAIEEWADESLYFIGLYFNWIEPEGARTVARTFRRSTMGAAMHLIYGRKIRQQSIAQGTGRKSHDHIVSDLDRHLDAAIALTSPGPFIFGASPSLGDFALMAQLTYLSHTARGEPIIEARPEIVDYLERFKPLRRQAA